MKTPSGSPPQTCVWQDADTQIWVARGFDMSLVNNGFTVPVGANSIATFQIVAVTGTLSTGVLTFTAADDPDGAQAVNHPSAVSRSSVGLSTTVPLEQANVGVSVTTAQASVTVDVYLVLRK